VTVIVKISEVSAPYTTEAEDSTRPVVVFTEPTEKACPLAGLAAASAIVDKLNEVFG
jgi:hypothetical protein